MIFKTIYIIVFFLFIIVRQQVCQTVNYVDDISYTVLSNTPPDSVKNFTIAAIPVFSHMNPYNIAFGSGVIASYRYKSWFSIEGELLFGYLDRFNEDYNEKSDHGYSVSGTKPFFQWESTVKAFLYSNTRKVIEKPTYQIIKGKPRITQKTKVPAIKLDLFGLRAGPYFNRSFIHYKGDNKSFTGVLVDGSPDDKIQFTGNGYNTMLRTSAVFIGASWTSISDLLIDVKDFGIKGVQQSAEIYADIFIAFDLSMNNMMIPMDYAWEEGGFYNYKELNVEKNTEVACCGYRIGFTWKPLMEKYSNYFNLEFGSVPGMGKNMFSNTFFILKYCTGFSTLWLAKDKELQNNEQKFSF